MRTFDGSKLRALREARHWSRPDLATAMNFASRDAGGGDYTNNAATLKAYEDGACNPSPERLALLVRALRCVPLDLESEQGPVARKAPAETDEEAALERNWPDAPDALRGRPSHDGSEREE